ncbi:hypothetical protein [Pantoea stewartii]|nr:hypothetical protein [Pantoea stewartii]
MSRRESPVIRARLLLGWLEEISGFNGELLAGGPGGQPMSATR